MVIIWEGMLWVFRFLIGACVFHFLNIVIFRLSVGENVGYKQDHCPDCCMGTTAGKRMSRTGSLLRRGRYAGCGTQIFGRYALTDCLGGMAFLFSSAFYGCGEFGVISLKGLLTFIYLGILTAVAWIDWDTKIIYDRFHLGIFFLGIVSMPLYPERILSTRILGALAAAFPMLVLSLLVEGAFGGGDIKLMASSGFLLGWRRILVAALLGLAAGGVYCAWMLFRRKLGRKDHFALGPFLAIGLAIACFYGEELLEWYLAR